jgi:replication-associated recombination protein RarA
MYICGQKNLITTIDELIERGKFPRFSIIVADTGCGKKVLSDYIAQKLGCTFVPCAIDVASIRDTIQAAYTITEPTLYMFIDCDDMSVAAKNSLLKVTEEPPNNAYFIMTVRDTSNVLGTILSRGTSFTMEPYSVSDIQDFITEKQYTFKDKAKKIVEEICVCPQDVMTANNTDIDKLYDLSDKFIQCIGATNLANELKITTMLNTKKDSDNGIDPMMFMRCVLFCCNTYIKNECTKEDLSIFHDIISVTTKYMTFLLKKGCNKTSVIDNWIIELHMKIKGGCL